jgi:Gram-negative porin
MKKFSYMILLATVALSPAVLMADDAMDANRVWAEPGDLIGQDNFVTATYGVDDQLGNEAKAGEDLGPIEDHRLTGIFAWSDMFGQGRWYQVRGIGDQGGGPDGIGNVHARGGKIGTYNFLVSYTRGEHLYDRTIENRLGMAQPLEMAVTPGFIWKNGVFKTHYKLNNAFSLSAGAQDIMREGTKASLLRDAGGITPPGRKDYDTDNRSMWIGVDWAKGKMAVNAKGSFQKNDGCRDLNQAHKIEDDRSVSAVSAGMSYVAAENLTLLGNYSLASTESKPVEMAGVVGNEMNRTRQAGTFAAMWNPAKHARLKVAATIRNLDGDGHAVAAATPYSYDRSRKSQRYRADLVYTGLKKTRVKAGWSYRSAELTEATYQLESVVGGAVESHLTDQTVNTNQMNLQVRHRFNTKYSAKAKYCYKTRSVEQTETGDMRYWMGDRSQDTGRIDLSLRARVARGINIDGGYQIIRQTYEREDLDDVKTEWNADRAFVLASWLVNDKLSVFGSLWYGHEENLIDGWTDTLVDQSATTYDTTTLRYAPGLSYRLLDTTTISGNYEAVRNTDSVENDFDRWSVKVDHRLGKTTSMAFAYRRYEFDEDRWDDYILDRYSLSLSKLF